MSAYLKLIYNFKPLESVGSVQLETTAVSEVTAVSSSAADLHKSFISAYFMVSVLAASSGLGRDNIFVANTKVLRTPHYNTV